ncbi:MAG TPA: FkbM family methyltransferase [Myxococcota bacterium]|jgi:FkbM family methyltransferase|nr:FkbM family methyltransferase [Myxococcota bacterium]
MPPDSLPRRLVKRLLRPLLNEASYSVLQGAAMAWDIRSGTMYEPELDLIRLAVRPGETAVDIGANYGLWCHHLARALQPGGRVVAFEPVPFTFRTLRLIARVLRFRGVELVEKGCGERPGSLTFTVPVQDSGAIIAGLVHMAGRDDRRPGKERHARFDRTKEITCDVVTVDDYLAGARNVTFLKCDIEGADLFALRGARKLLAEQRPTVVCEINPWFLEGFGLKTADLVQFFDGLGYVLYRYVGERAAGRLRPWSPAAIEEDNWVFVHPSRLDRLRGVLAE